MNIFSFTAVDTANPLTDIWQRLDNANQLNNLCIHADNNQFSPATANEIYNYFSGGLRYKVGTDASFRDGFMPIFGEIYNAGSKELLRSEPVATDDNIVITIYFPNFEQYFSVTAQNELKEFFNSLGGIYGNLISEES